MEDSDAGRGAAFLDLLYAGAPESAFDAVVEQAEADGVGGDALAALRRHREMAGRLRERRARQQNREAQLTALYETAHDLIAIRDVDAILTAIVRRARQLLGADMTYLSLNDEAEGASFMKVTDGSISAEFRTLRLPLGTGLLGLVAQTGAPYHTDDYQNDARFVHRDFIDHAVADEGIRAILGVPLLVEGRVIGALLAVHRTVRAFPPDEVTLLTSFAAHAAVALENARLFEETQRALADLDEAHQRLGAQTRAVSAAAAAHDRLTTLLLHGGDLAEVAAALAETLDGAVTLLDAEGRALVGPPPPREDAPLADAVAESRASGRVAGAGPGRWVAAALAGAEPLGTVVLDGRADLDLSARRVLERGAMVTALVLLLGRTVADAEDRARGDLLSDLLSDRDLDRGGLRERCRRHGADLDELGVVLAAQLGSELAGDRRRAGAAVAGYAADHHGLGGWLEDRLVAALPASVDAAEAGEALAERLRGLGAGAVSLGVAAAPAGAVRRAWREADAVLRTLLALGRTGCADAAGLGLARLLLGHNGPTELRSFVEVTLGPVLDYDARRGTELRATLETWYAAGGSPTEAARRLHVHPNTVVQRLDRVGALLGEGWRDPERALEQQLALRVWRLAT